MRVRLLPNEEAELVVVGQIGAPYGVKGWNHVRSFTSPSSALLDYDPWFVKTREGWLSIVCEEGRNHGDSLVVRLQGVEDRDKAALMTQSMIAIKRSQRAALPEDEFYWSDLEGLSIRLVSGLEWGTIRHLYNNAGVDIMVIDHNGKEFHVPFIMNDTVVKVDLAERYLLLDWSFDYPEG